LIGKCHSYVKIKRLFASASTIERCIGSGC
jgi:hypothetical protein